MDKNQKCEEACRALISTINNTGGLVANTDGTYGCEGDRDWTDLADAYLKACEALGEVPVRPIPWRQEIITRLEDARAAMAKAIDEASRDDFDGGVILENISNRTPWSPRRGLFTTPYEQPL